MLYPEFDELVSYKDLKWDFSLSSPPPPSAPLSGGQPSFFRGRGLEFDSVREYVPGDDIRNIDWRVTARTGSPHLKIFQEERRRSLVLCLDLNERMKFGTRGTFKSVQAARVASLLGWRGMAQHDRVSACLFGDVPGGLEFFTPHQGRRSLLRLLRRLSQKSSEKHSVPLVEALRRVSGAIHTGSTIYVISDFLELEGGEGLEVWLGRLKQRGDVVLISVNDPADKALLPVGAIEIASRGSQRLVVNTDSRAGREAYARQWEENRKGLHQKTERLGIPLLELMTDSDIKKELWLSLKRLSKGRR